MELVFMPSFSLEPNKVTSFNRVFYKDKLNEKLLTANEIKKTVSNKFKELRSNNKVERIGHNFEISDNAYRTLKRKINWLYYLAKSKSVKTYSGKEIYNFKINFITLTLPSKQRECTKDTTNKLLNNFLTELRQRTKLTNYVWRLEFQKNGNVHYHIVTDTYLDYFFIQKIWNRLLKLNGYIEAYQEKFSKLSLSEYNKLINPNNKLEFQTVAKRYAKAKSENWSNPPSVDVKSVVSKQAIANYISKYFSKSSDKTSICNELDNADNSNNLRLWFCSRSLSKLNSISKFCEEVQYDIFSVVSFCEQKRTVYTKWAKMIFFEIASMTGAMRVWLEKLLRGYAFGLGYVPGD